MDAWTESHPVSPGAFRAGPTRASRDGSASRRILVVDDQPFVCRVVARLLGRAGYDAWSAGDGHEALAFLEEREFDLLLTDVRMPGMDGPELVRRARRHRPELAVLYMSGHVGNSVGRPDRIDEDPLLGKPFGSSQLYRAIVEVLEGTGAAGVAQRTTVGE